MLDALVDVPGIVTRWMSIYYDMLMTQFSLVSIE